MTEVQHNLVHQETVVTLAILFWDQKRLISTDMGLIIFDNRNYKFEYSQYFLALMFNTMVYTIVMTSK